MAILHWLLCPPARSMVDAPVNISDTILRARLQDVYWITGGACSGKTTVTELLAKKHGLAVFPDRVSEYQAAADLDEFPQLRDPSPETDWEWFFNRPIDEYVKWLQDVNSALLQFILVDLLSGNLPRPIVVEQFTNPAETAAIAAHASVVSMYTTEDLLRAELLNRADHRMILDCIKANTSNPSAAEANVINASLEAARRSLALAESAGCKIIYRTKDTRPEDLLLQVEVHFGLSS